MSSYSVLQYRPNLTGESINVAVVVTRPPMSTYAGHRITSDWERVGVFARLHDTGPLRERVEEVIADYGKGTPVYMHANSVLRFTDFHASTLPAYLLLDRIAGAMLEGRV